MLRISREVGYCWQTSASRSEGPASVIAVWCVFIGPPCTVQVDHIIAQYQVETTQHRSLVNSTIQTVRGSCESSLKIVDFFCFSASAMASTYTSDTCLVYFLVVCSAVSLAVRYCLMPIDTNIAADNMKSVGLSSDDAQLCGTKLAVLHLPHNHTLKR